MSSNKRTSRVKNGILIAVVIAFLIAIVGGTYARFVSRGTALSSTDIAKWHIVLGGTEDISSESKILTVPVQDALANQNVAEGKLAPGKTVVATFKVDPTGSEVAVDYLMNVDLSNISGFSNSELEISNIKYTLEGTNTEEDIFIDDETGNYIFEEYLADVLEGKDVTFKIYITWTESTELERSLADTVKAVNIDNILIPVNIVARQHIGDGQATPPEATTYTVTFKDGETTLSTQTVEEGATATRPTEPTKEGYDFVNWYSDSEFTTEFDFTSTITENTTIYAKWKETTPPAATYTSYSVGDTVTLGGETFYVIEDSDANTSTVKLLAALNVITTEGNAKRYKQDASANTLAFDSTSPYTNVYANSTIITEVNNYKTAVEGRMGDGKTIEAASLMTKEEVEALGGDSSNWTTSGCTGKTAFVKATNYWLGSPYETAGNSTWYVYGSGFSSSSVSRDNRYGLRPVLEVLKSNI